MPNTVKISARKLKLLERDAARYRFLRKASEPEVGIGVWNEDGKGNAEVGGWLVFEELDREIDAAIKREKTKLV